MCTLHWLQESCVNCVEPAALKWKALTKTLFLLLPLIRMTPLNQVPLFHSKRLVFIKSLGPLYERIGSIRRQYMISTGTDEKPQIPSMPRPPVPSPMHSPGPFTGSSVTCSLPPEDRHGFSKCVLPSEGAPLPPRPPTLGLVRGESASEHNYESLPSTFGVESPEDTMYAHITTPEAEPESPPYVPENSE